MAYRGKADERDRRRHTLLGPRLPVGVLRLACPCGAAMALRRPARVAARHHRADRAGRPVRPPRLHAGGGGPGLPGLPPARHGLPHHTARRGMPFPTQPRARVSATGPACRAIVATRLFAPEYELAVFRALQFAWFTTPLILDDPGDLVEALERIEGFDAAGVLARVDERAVEEAYQADRVEARTPAGSPTEAQGKAASTDGPVRYTAPSLIFERD